MQTILRVDLKPIILFDMDGTLTLPRKSIDWSTIVAMREIQKHADIGIVSGSPYEYIVEQMSLAWREINSLRPDQLSIMPCNGTKLYEFTKENGPARFELTHSADMISHMGQEAYRILVSILTDMQNQFIENYTDVPFSGNFFSLN